ncbi:O-acyltransferase WSD1-like [Vigna unguiculata]|uniref:Diacylglycerol O-acyltransferase n=1 Tax=Vigna unguiculata TaxID=3917 RepID=A0A4D6LYI9_VIGUN|nr:O-acyltransferase WSD1-like [Vigna unguiculata]QCD93952.1 diacylglycerol O-acyltransferase [Vigna unguiculata]
MEAFDEGEIMEPVSPTGQYLTSSSLSIYILAVMETELPIVDDSQTLPLLHNLFLPINPRFSSIMIRDKNGDKKWKKVEVKLEDHIKVPTFESGNNSSNFLYDEYLDEYMSKIAVEQLPQHRPLWELHIIKYPTSKGMGSLVFKLHHALGDGFSLMGALLSCMERADKISLPFTLPSTQNQPKSPISNTKVLFKRLPSIFLRTVSDFGWSLLKSNFVEDDQTPIRSAAEDTKTRHINISDVTFSLDLVREVKSKLGVSINDVVAGVIFFGIRLYMEEMSVKSREGHSTALVLLNTRNIEGYKSIKEMVEKKNSNSAWGNQYAFLHVPIPELTDSKYANPLHFIWEAHQEIARKKTSFATPLTGMLLDTLRKLRGTEAAAKYLYSTLRNSSTTISNMIGPVEQMAVANVPIKGFYFMVAGSPESLTMTIMSYMGKIRIAFGVEKDFIDKKLFKSSLENALQIIVEAARQIKA